MLGIIIGIAAVVAIIGIMKGSQQQIFENIQALGTNLINVSPGRVGGSAGARWQMLRDVFTVEDGEFIASKASAVAQVAPIVSRGLLLQQEDQNTQITVYGVTPEYEDVLNFHVESGRFINFQDLRSYGTVIVLGQQVAEDLFGNENPIGQRIVVHGSSRKYKFQVIGLMEPKGQVMFYNFDNQAFIPVTTAQKRLFNTKYVDSFSIQARDEGSANEALEQIDAILYQKFEDDTKYEIRSQEELLSTMESVTQIFTVLLVGIAGISLLVGGIGIMNIMLVSVTERTREIGIRMAVGAKRADILLQFLWESVMLCLVGGVIGIAVGWIGSKGLGAIGSGFMPGINTLPTIISPQAMLLALGFATAVGLFFGMYPANKASKLDPVEALRYE
jgi:putative ABC transport system permease protein